MFENFDWSDTARRSRPSVIADLMATALARPGLLSLAAGFTDNAIGPSDIVQEAVAALPQSGEALQYSSNQGRPTLREHISEWMRKADEASTNAVAASGDPKGSQKQVECAAASPTASLPAQGIPGPSGIVLTNGSQQSLYLLSQALCNPGDIVLVESPTYFVAFDVLAGLGIEPVSIPARPDGQTDPEGCRELLKKLERNGKLGRVKMAYLVTYYSNPGSHCMELDIKRKLGNVIGELIPNVPILEDTAYRELWYESPYPAPSLFDLPEWASTAIVQTGSFSKCFAPGLRLGYMATNNAAIVEQVLRIKAQQDFGSSNLSQYIADYAFASGRFAQYLPRMRAHYKEKALLMHEAFLEGELTEKGWTWNRPDGGLIFWLKGPAGLDTSVDSPFCNACLEANVLYVPGNICFATESPPRNCIRIAIGVPPAEDLKEAARRFAKVARSM